ncbi:MAG: GDSL-type esterase/lipase family protein [Prevotellaceae bacterium]|jgi:lysophospholipase L1-like esterase|nr:GDSL-type esterase/lipase family protein [Prevotellaceae bacterium]
MRKNIILTIIGSLFVFVAIRCEGPVRFINIPEDEIEQPGEGVPQDFSHTGPDVVFIGNSITRLFREYSAGGENWFDKNNYVGKGIDGQTSTTIKNRFDNDVLALDPWCVVISCGTNDIARNGGYVSLETIMANIETMAQKAKALHIKVFLASVTPACSFWWNTTDSELTVAYIKKYIKDLNVAIKEYAELNNFTYVDYYSATKDQDDCAPSQYFYDGVHPSAAGFEVMASVVKPLLDKALGK